jgi:WD40 repeat protein
MGPSLAPTHENGFGSGLMNFLCVVQIASGYADGIIRLWDSERGIFHTNLNEHSKAVTVLRYNKLGSKLASGGKENYIVVWDVPTGTCQYHLVGHSDQVCHYCFSIRFKPVYSDGCWA